MDSISSLVSEHKHSHPLERVLVLGSGNFGTCLADHLAYLKHQVTLYCRSEEIASSINQYHRNSKYLPNITLTETLVATSQCSEKLFVEHDLLLFAIPTQNMRSFLTQIKQWIRKDHLLLFVNKGIEESSLKLPCHIIDEVLGKNIGQSAVFLSGPSFAVEVLKREVTCVTVASVDSVAATRVQQIFHAPFFRVYLSKDPIGVEVAGALKNVVAIAAGICSGLGMQQNARAALITRGLAELTAMGVALGAKPVTFLGLSGMGDLVLTASSTKSRNFTVGQKLGQGEKLKDILESLGSVAEGVTTTRAAYKLSKELQVEVPIVETIYHILYEEVAMGNALKQLLLRNAAHEFAVEIESFSSTYLK